MTDQRLTDVDARRPDRPGLAVTIRDLATPIFYHWRKALIAFLIPLVLALAAASLAKPIYTAQSRLLILLGDDYVFRRAVGEDVSGNPQTFDRAQIVHAEMEILGSRELREKTLNDIGLTRVYPEVGEDAAGMNLALEQLGRDLHIENVPQSNTIEVRLRHRDPKVAADFVNRLVQNYIASRRDIFRRADSAAVTGQQRDLSDQLAATEALIADLSNRYAIGDYDQEVQGVQAQQTTLTAQLAAQDQLIAAAAARAERLSEQLRSAPSVISLNTDEARSQQVTALTENLMLLRERRRVAGARYSEGYPLVVELDRQIADFEAQIAAAPQSQTALVRSGPNPVSQQIETQLATTRGELAGLRSGRAQAAQALQAARDRLAELVEIGPRYRELVRQRTLTETAYRSVAENAEDARLQSSIAGANANVRVIEAAQPPSKARTGRALILAVGLLLGGVAALAVIIVSTATSPVMLTPRDVESRLRTPVLAAVPLSDDDEAPSPRWRPTLPRLTADQAALILRQLKAAAEGSAVMVVVGPEDGVGASSIAVDLAMASAFRSGAPTLLIDAEPVVDGGLAMAIHGRGARLASVADNPYVMRVEDSNLHVTTPMTRAGSNISEARWRSFIEGVQPQFQVVIIDAPSLQRSSAALLLAPLADLSLIVIEAEETRTAVASNLIERVTASGGTVAGVILNMRRFHIPRFIYTRI
ncbi:MAG: exopolysaccharide transport family protein [Brevundimonas sp.]